MQDAPERMISDEAQIARILIGLKNDPFYTHLVSLFAKEFNIYDAYAEKVEANMYIYNI